MPRPISFRKYHGIGNDFILFDGISHELNVKQLTDPFQAAALCDRHGGIGADGLLIVLLPVTPNARARMRVINADGSEPEMCGNGIRCVAKALHDRILAKDKPDALTIDTGAGPLECQLTRGFDQLVRSVRVDMGRPSLDPASLPMLAPEAFVNQPIAGTPDRGPAAVRTVCSSAIGPPS